MCIETRRGRGGVSKHIIWTFFIIVDERSLNSKVFMIIEVSSEKKWKQKLGIEYKYKLNAR